MIQLALVLIVALLAAKVFRHEPLNPDVDWEDPRLILQVIRCIQKRRKRKNVSIGVPTINPVRITITRETETDSGFGCPTIETQTEYPVTVSVGTQYDSDNEGDWDPYELETYGSLFLKVYDERLINNSDELGVDKSSPADTPRTKRKGKTPLAGTPRCTTPQSGTIKSAGTPTSRQNMTPRELNFATVVFLHALEIKYGPSWLCKAAAQELFGKDKLLPFLLPVLKIEAKRYNDRVLDKKKHISVFTASAYECTFRDYRYKDHNIALLTFRVPQSKKWGGAWNRMVELYPNRRIRDGTASPYEAASTSTRATRSCRPTRLNYGDNKE